MNETDKLIYCRISYSEHISINVTVLIDCLAGKKNIVIPVFSIHDNYCMEIVKELRIVQFFS
jgi:hypothetical protein